MQPLNRKFCKLPIGAIQVTSWSENYQINLLTCIPQAKLAGVSPKQITWSGDARNKFLPGWNWRYHPDISFSCREWWRGTVLNKCFNCQVKKVMVVCLFCADEAQVNYLLKHRWLMAIMQAAGEENTSLVEALYCSVLYWVVISWPYSVLLASKTSQKPLWFRFQSRNKLWIPSL